MSATHDLLEFPESDRSSAVARARKRRSEVARDVVSASYLRGSFTLASGASSSFYVDKYLFETRPTILRQLAEMLAESVNPDVDRLIGTEVGGIALVAAVSLASGVPFVIVRHPAAGGARERIRGELHAGETVALVHDVVDSGSQVRSTAELVIGHGARVATVLAVVDREAGAGQAISAAGLHYEPLFQLSELGVHQG